MCFLNLGKKGSKSQLVSRVKCRRTYSEIHDTNQEITLQTFRIPKLFWARIISKSGTSEA